MMFKEKTGRKIGVLGGFVALALLAFPVHPALAPYYFVFVCVMEILLIVSIDFDSPGFLVLYFCLSAGFILFLLFGMKTFDFDKLFNFIVYLFVGYLAYFAIRSAEEELAGNKNFITEEKEKVLENERNQKKLAERRESVEEQTRQLQYLSGMLNKAWSITSFNELSAFFVKQTSKIFGDSPVVLSVMDRETVGQFRNKAATGVGIGNQEGTVSNLPDAVYELGKPLIIEDISREINYKVAWHSPDCQDIRSVMAVPVSIDDRFSAVLECYGRSTRVFNSYSLRVLHYIGEMLSILLLNAVLYEKTEKLARTDGITGMFVQNYFIERIQEEIFRVRKQNSRFSLLIIDIDNFKIFNDTYGHQVGDFVLVKTAELITRDLRVHDFPCRYGGDEFFILLPETDKAGAVKAAERIREKVCEETRNLSFEHIKLEKNITVSIGVDEYRQDYGEYKDFINRVDKCMYEAKRLGKNRVVAEVPGES